VEEVQSLETLPVYENEESDERRKERMKQETSDKEKHKKKGVKRYANVIHGHRAAIMGDTNL
jgi:hypothetical protein